ncbi:MAG: hypothetical protein Q9188_002745 [Gyalolechia gomerana]
MAIIEERVGDIFDSPPHSILIHACNTAGSWGKGVAAAFKKYSPSAYQVQNLHCKRPSSPSTPLPTHQRNLVGTCLLLPPFFPAQKTKPTDAQLEKQFWIACLFTSRGYGKNTDTAEDILDATKRAVEDLGRQIREYKESFERGEVKDEMGGCVGVRINSGLFGVEWERTKEVLEGGGVDMLVLRPAEMKGGDDGVKKGVKRKDGPGDKEGHEEEEVNSKPPKRKKPEEDVDTSGEKRQTRLRFGKV